MAPQIKDSEICVGLKLTDTIPPYLFALIVFITTYLFSLNNINNFILLMVEVLCYQHVDQGAILRLAKK